MALYMALNLQFSVANFFQHFPARMAKKFRPLSKKVEPPCKNSIYHFIKMRPNFEAKLVQKSVKISGFQSFYAEKIKETKHFKNSAPFRPFMGKSG
jgi:hypothetical protein